MKIRIATRGSALALTQSNQVASQLRELDCEVDLVTVKTSGDRDQQSAFAQVGAPGVFVRELEEALLDGRADLAVHSYKDLPSRSAEGLLVAAVPERVDPADVLLIRKGRRGDGSGTVPPPSPVGTASARRRALLNHFRPELEVRHLRGNVPTRIRKLAEGQYGAIVLAAAGLLRLETSLDEHDIVTERLDPAQFVPAPTQGALACQVRGDDSRVRAIVAKLDRPELRESIQTERRLLTLVDGGCDLPFGAWCRKDGTELVLSAALETKHGLRTVVLRGTDPDALAGAAWDALQKEAP